MAELPRIHIRGNEKKTPQIVCQSLKEPSQHDEAHTPSGVYISICRYM